MMVVVSSLLSSLVVERLGHRIGLGCMFALFVAAFLCVLYERLVFVFQIFLKFLPILYWNSNTSSHGSENVCKFNTEFCLLVGCRFCNDIRFCMMFQLILPLAVPVIAFMYRSRYTHSRYWFLCTGMSWF